MLTVPPLLWAGNAVVGRLVSDLVPPITLNFCVGRLLFHPSSLSLAFAQTQQPALAVLAQVCSAEFVRRGLLQRAAVFGIANLHPTQRDLGGGQHPVFMLAIGALFLRRLCGVHSGWAQGSPLRGVGGFIAR